MSNADLQQLLDKQAIEEVLIDYCRCLDEMALDDLAALFTDDCAVSYGPGPALESQSRADLAKSLQRMWRWSRTSHHLANARIWLDGDQARAVSYVEAWHERPDGSSATIWGQYRDRLVRQAGTWLIAERRMEMNGSDAGFTVNIYPLDRRPPPDGWTAPDIDHPPRGEK